MPELKSYKVFVAGHEFVHAPYVNHVSAGKAKVEFWRDLPDGYPYTCVRAKLNGLPYTSEDFKRNAEYRRIPFAYCGMKVNVQDVGEGYIVGCNDSANLDVLFFDGKYKGHTLNCHPHSGVTYFDNKGNVIPVNFN